MILAITIAANYLIYALFAAVVIAGFFRYRTNQRLFAAYLIQIGLTCLFGFVIVSLFQAVFPTDRPFVALGTNPLIPHAPDPSFPSSHALYGGVMTGFLWQSNEKWGVAAFIMLLAICTGRVLALVHYPVDVIVGACLGILLSFAVPYLWSRRSV
jgi:undecaprenyl-diphosphatase